MLSHICIIRADLRPGIQAAYLIHAAGESVRGPVPSGTRSVALAAESETHLRAIALALRSFRVEHTSIEEDGELYAIGVEPLDDLTQVHRVTSGLPLVA